MGGLVQFDGSASQISNYLGDGLVPDPIMDSQLHCLDGFRFSMKTRSTTNRETVLGLADLRLICAEVRTSRIS